MNVKLREDEALAMRLLAETAWTHRRRLAVLGGAFLALAVTLAAVMSDRFVSRSSLLFLLGPEYAVQEPAGGAGTANTTMDPDRILGTEDSILQSDDLHRAVIRAIGIGRLYPDLLAPPDAPHRLLAAVLGVPTTIGRALGLVQKKSGAADPMDLASAIFAGHLVTKPSKEAAVIAVAFSHKDPKIARDTLLCLERLFLERRRALYAPGQTGTLEAQATTARASLDTSVASLARFRAGHTLPDYATQMTIALHAEGDAAADQANARRAVASAEARRDIFAHAMGHLPAIVSGGVDLDRDTETGPVRQANEDLRSAQVETLSRFRPDSAYAHAIAAQTAARAGDFAAEAHAPVIPTAHTVRNPSFDTAVEGFTGASADLASAVARLAADTAEVSRLQASVAALDADARALERLTAEHDMRFDNWRRLAGLAAAQDSVEGIEARAVPAVRVATPPSFPTHPSPRRLLVLVAGVALAFFAPAGAALVLNAARRTVRLAGEIERLGVPVIGTVAPDDAFARLGPIRPILRSAG